MTLFRICEDIYERVFPEVGMLSLTDISVASLSPKYVGKGHLRGFYVSVDLEMNEIFGILSELSCP